MFKKPVDMTEQCNCLKRDVKVLKEEVQQLRNKAELESTAHYRELAFKTKEHELAVSVAKHQKAKECEEALIKSDLERVEAVSFLKAYKEMDTKTEREHGRKMLEKAIDGLAKKVEVNVQK